LKLEAESRKVESLPAFGSAGPKDSGLREEATRDQMVGFSQNST